MIAGKNHPSSLDWVLRTAASWRFNVFAADETRAPVAAPGLVSARWTLRGAVDL